MIKTCVPNAARLAILKGGVRPAHVFRVHLITNAANLNLDSTVFRGVGEVTGEGYGPLKLPEPVYGITSDNEAFMDFPDEVKWPKATVSAQGCVICDHTLDDLILAVASFGSTITSPSIVLTSRVGDIQAGGGASASFSSKPTGLSPTSYQGLGHATVNLPSFNLSSTAGKFTAKGKHDLTEAEILSIIMALVSETA